MGFFFFICFVTTDVEADVHVRDTRGGEENDRNTPDTNTTHYLFLVDVARAVGGGEGGGASLTVPGDIAILGGAADGQGVDAVGVAVTVTAVLLPPAVPRRPHKDGAQTTTTLCNSMQKGFFGEFGGSIYSFAIIFWAPAGTVDVDVLGI